MFILIISRGVPSTKNPHWGCFEKDQAEALTLLGHKVVVASIDTRFLWEWRKIGITKTTINNIVYYDSFIVPGAITNLFGQKINLIVKQWQMGSIYKEIIREHGKPDIIYGHFSFITSNAVKVAKENNIPLVGMEHNGAFLNPKLSAHTEFSSKYVYQHTDLIISVSQSLREGIMYHMGKDSVVVHNTYGKEFFYKEKQKNKKLSIISVGRLTYDKGFDILIEALSIIKNQLPQDWELLIAGEGDYRNVLQQQINEAKLEKHISLIGWRTKPEIAALIQQSDIFVLPSRYESFGVVYIEALACGAPIIATDCGVPKELVTNENGLFIPSENITALATAILQISENINQYDRKAISEDCKARFSAEVLAKKLTNIFEDIIQNYENNTID